MCERKMLYALQKMALPLMILPLMALGIYKNPFTCAGKNGIAKVIAATTVCLREKKKEQHLIKGLSNIMVNGPSNVSVAFSRDVELTERLDYSSAVALLGYSLILAILRSFNVRDEAGRVMVTAPLIALITTHILYLNNYKMDYGCNMKVCAVMAVTQLLVWAVWAAVSHHPSRWKLWIVVYQGRC